jgi:tetratricopeptide (TPR) repeat protein
MTASVGARAGAAVVLLAGAASHVDARQNPETARERSRLEWELKRYHGIVNAYREGKDDSIAEILAWDPERLTKIVAAAQSPLDMFRPWDAPRVKAAAMLHTDAAIRVLTDEARLGFHLSLAGRLLQVAGPDLHPVARAWYIAVSRLLRERAMLFVAEGLLERGRKLLPRDAAILYESGVLQEQIATFAAFITETVFELPAPRSHSGALQTTNERSRLPANRHVMDQADALDKAAASLGDAVDADPSHELARLHLGRVQILRGKQAEGLKLLAPLAASAVETDTAYLATMFLGAMHHRRGRYAEAEQMYRAAIDKVPAAQSAYVALSEVLQRVGRGDESRVVLLGVLRTPAVSRTEPWWWYLAEPIADAKQRVDALRKSARQ